MYDLITYTTNKGQSGTLDPSSSPSIITRTIDFDTVWIDLSVDLEQSPNPEYIRGWFFELNELPGYSFYPNSSAIQTGLNPPEKRIFTSNQKIRLYIDLNTMLQLDGLRPHDFVLSTVVATSEENLKRGNWIETNRSDLFFTIYANGNPPVEFLDVLPETLFESDFGEPTRSLTIDSAYINGMRVDSAHIRHLAYVNLLEGDSAYFTNVTTNKILTDLLSANINSDISILSNLNIDSNKIIGIGSENSGNVLDLDYDEPTDRNNSIALTSVQSIHNFLDVNNSEDSNYWALYNNLNAYSDSINRNNAIFLIDEDGTVTAKAINVNQYILDSDGLKWSNDSNARIYYDSNLKLWKIEPGLFEIVDSEQIIENNPLLSIISTGRDGQFLSFAESAESYYLDYALKTGRFIIDEQTLAEEKDYIPDTELESMDSNAKYIYYDRFSRFSHLYDQGVTFPLTDSDAQLLDSDAQVLRYDETTNSIYGDFATTAFSGIISPKRYDTYRVKATFNSTTPTDFPIFLVVAQLKIRGKEYTISAFRRPKGTLQTYGDYLETGQIITEPPSWGLVYNFGQKDAYYFDFDWVSRGSAPAPVTPNFEGESTSDWVSSGQTTVFAEKVGNVISVVTNQFGDTNIENFEFRTGIELDIEKAIANGKTFLAPFLNAETSYGFGVKGQSGVIISDIAFETEDPEKYIFDLKNDIVYTYISERNLTEGNYPTVPVLVENAGYYALDSSVGVSDIMKTGRFFYNERTKTLFWKDPDNTYKLIQEVDLNRDFLGKYIELRGTGLNNNSPAYLYINNEPDYFEFDENPIFLNGYHGHGRGLNLTIFGNDGTKISSNTYDTHGDSANSTLLADAINNMSNGQIGAITSYDAWISNVNDKLKTAALSQGLMKFYNAPKFPIRNPYAAVFQKTGSETPRSHETTSGDSSLSPHADLSFHITRGTFHTYGPEQPNSLSAWNGKKEAWIDENHNTKINQTLMLTEGRRKGMAFEETSFTSTGINEDSARIYLTSEEDSQRTLVIRVGDDLNDKIAFEVPDIDGVLQNGFINFHRGNLHIVYDQTPQLGGDLDVQDFRIYKDSLAFELFDLGYSLGKGDNSIATASRQSIFNFIDKNDNETDNFFGIFSNKEPLIEATTVNDAIFAVMEDGSVIFNFANAGTGPTEIGGSTGRQTGLTTDDVPEGPSGLNLYFDSARVFLALKYENNNANTSYDANGGGIGNITVDQANKTLKFDGITNTDGLPEGSTNLYFTDERAQDAVGSIMSGDDDISVVYDDGANTIAITSTLTQETVFGLQSKYSLTSAGGGALGQVKLNIDSNGIQRSEIVNIRGTNGINVSGDSNYITVDASDLVKNYNILSDNLSNGAELILRETDINNNATDDQVAFIGTEGISISQTNGNSITISGIDLQAVSRITATENGNQKFITLIDSSPVAGVTTTNLLVTGANGLEVDVDSNGAGTTTLDFSAAALQITSTLQADSYEKIIFTETDADGNTSSQFIRFVGDGGMSITSRGPQGTDDGQITISAASMHHPNTTYVTNFATPILNPTNIVDFNLIHEGPDSGENTTLKIKSKDGILVEESNGELVIGAIVQIEQINNETISFETNGDSGISFGSTTSFTTNSSTSETIQVNHGATGSGTTVATNNSGQTVIQNITVDKFGHIQSTSNATVAGQYLMSATDANNDPVIRLDTQANGQSGSAEDVIIEGQGAVKISVGTGGTDKIIIRVDSSDFANIAFNDLTDGNSTNTSNSNTGHDVTLGNLNHVGHVPAWDGTNFTTRKLAFNGHDITDLDVGGVAFEEVLAWVGPNYPVGGGQNAWRNAALSDLLDIPSSIDDLSDVDTTTTAPTNGQALVWDGSNFVPGDVAASLAMNDLTDVSTSSITDGQVLIYQSSSSSFIPGDAGNTYTAGDGLDLSVSNEFSLDIKANMGLVIDNTELSIDTTVKTDNIQAQTASSSVTLSNSGGNTKLEITNDGGLNLNGTLANTFTVSAAGAVVAADDISAFSDERLKTDVKTIDNALYLVNKLRGVSFTKNKKSGIGVIAQEIEKIIPEVVNTAEDEMGTKSVAYGNLVGVLIEAIKELSEKVEKLERKI